MQLSRRITGLTAGGSDGWDVYYRAKDMLAAGQPVVQLTIGEHDIGTDRKIIDAMHAAAVGGHVGYSMFNGNLNLREAVAARVTARTGVPTTPDNVLVVPGGQAGLFAAHHAACDEGDTALYIDPYYATYPGTIRGVGAKAQPVFARPERNFQPDPAEIAAVAPQAKSLLINTPNNPTGVIYTRDTMEGIAGVCQEHDLWLISDEVYDTMIWQGEHVSPRTLPGMAERTLVVGSMSKSHAMTGSRIGWIIGPEEAIEHLGNLSTHTTYGVAGFVQEAATFALSQGDAFETGISQPFRRRRDLVIDMLEGQNAVRAIPADGGMFVMLDVRATGLSGEDFADRLLTEHLVGVMPGESFGKAAAGHIRVALTVDDDRLAGAIGLLIELATELAA
ncbi:pyridoxal phosphate-dependent aminotransferase [Roseovarius sp.]|uniref:pyridoxal phosphate-dependent aminotransferase n=1 Tax=Roseovarius sp. TaxID=1486281 RepID=UPI002606D6F1|nr:pyridoxal phosphate-dependent aminotransferase [Roseovarius sp.]MDM8165368.1 pyridoxal phosphate-dependent aminotransferase [Roseovarius sp.]